MYVSFCSKAEKKNNCPKLYIFYLAKTVGFLFKSTMPQKQLASRIYHETSLPEDNTINLFSIEIIFSNMKAVRISQSSMQHCKG